MHPILVDPMTTSSCSSPSSSADGHPSLDDWVRALLDGKNYATVATIGRDGSPQNSVVWIKAEGDTVLFSSLDHRQKVRNLRRDPRISVSVYDLANPHRRRDPGNRRDRPGRGEASPE
jgi:hypothetical protein